MAMTVIEEVGVMIFIVQSLMSRYLLRRRIFEERRFAGSSYIELAWVNAYSDAGGWRCVDSEDFHKSQPKCQAN